MDKGTKIILAIALAGLLIMLVSLGHDFFSKKSTASESAALRQPYALVSMAGQP